MKKTIKIIALIFSTVLGNLWVQAQEKNGTLSVETDPSTFLFKGFAIHARYQPKNSKHLQVGAGIYALDLPNVMVNINKDNKDKGWDARINSAFALFGEYYLTEAPKKWFVGLQTGIQNYKNTNDKIPEKESKYTNLLIMPSVGYSWYPFKNQFYIKPWFGIGYTSKISGENYMDNLEYKISSIVSFLTLHVGYTFGK